MRKIILILLIFSLLSLVTAAGDNWKLYFSDGITKINGTDVCIDINGVNKCLSATGTGGGDISAVNTAGKYLTGGSESGVVNLLLNETILNLTIDSRSSATTYTNGSGISLVGTQFNHSDTSSQSSSDNSGNTFIQDIILDTFGHITSIVTTVVDFTDYFTRSDIIGFGYYNSTDFSISDYYLKSNPFSFWNDSYATFNKTYADTLYADISIDGTVTSIATTGPISGGTITTTGTISLTACSNAEIYKYNSTSSAWECESDAGQEYTAGSGITITGAEINHTDTSSQSDSDNSGNTFIQDIILDTFGHITSIVTAVISITNIFDQSLNTTDDVVFNSVNVTTDFRAITYRTTGSGLAFNFYDDGSDITMNVSNGGGDFFIEQDNSKLALFNSPSSGNDFKVFQVFSKQASDVTEFVVTKAADTHASYFIRSLSIAGNSTNNPTPFNCSTYTNYIDCSTDITGADLWVEDDIELGGTIYVAEAVKAGDWTNVSIIESQVSDADWWDADGDINADEISESKINFITACAAGNHYYLSGNDLACEADDYNSAFDTEDEIEAVIFDNDNTANLGMGSYNITAVECIVFDSGGSICSGS